MTLRRVTIERKGGGWELVREMAETADRWEVDDLLEAFACAVALHQSDGCPYLRIEIVNKGFRPDGTLRVSQRQS